MNKHSPLWLVAICYRFLYKIRHSSPAIPWLFSYKIGSSLLFTPAQQLHKAGRWLNSARLRMTQLHHTDTRACPLYRSNWTPASHSQSFHCSSFLKSSIFSLEVPRTEPQMGATSFNRKSGAAGWCIRAGSYSSTLQYPCLHWKFPI